MEVGNMAHSHSQPGEMDRTPPGTPKKGGKMLAVRVQMLDDTVTMFQIQAKALGRVLFDQVCNQLNLLESDYFGLEYQEAGGTKYWLDLEKPVCRQIGLSLVDILVRFCVKFYTPDPSQLEEEFTRYLFCLQIKRDLSQGLLQCNNNTAALMASYIVQAECGDYVVEDYPDHRYLSSYKFVPNQDQELERRIMENHKKHAGQSPAEADLNLLETARRCELYGIKMHPAKDHEGCPLNLAVAHMGIVVFQNFSKINTFSWAKIRKISFKRKRFLVKLHPEGYGYYKDTVEFFFEGRNECKNFWKKCVENHGFFRCTMVKKVPRQKTRVLSRGSSFRYSGRTQKQIVDFVRENYVKRQTFQRSQSFRHSSSAHSSVANVGTSISAHPLLPLGDNAVAGTPASLSCDSMTLTSSPVHTADIHVGGSPSPPLTTSVSPGTSVTSSPQHIYPQETPYRRTGHRLMKVKRPPVRSHHAISPLLSPTDAATTADNRSANHSNKLALDGKDMSSRNSLKSLEFVYFNDVYSNCYTSLKSLKNDLEDDMIIDDVAKTDIIHLPGDFLNGADETNDSIRSMTKKPKTLFSEKEEDMNRYTWHRSASCKELYRDGENKKEKNVMTVSDPNYEIEPASPDTRYDRARRKCYSAVTSKNPSIDRTGDVGGDLRVYSSSYPGTTSSLSTESAEGELDDGIVEVLDVKYDSQEEIVLSHDDVSHDSYELLERELEESNDQSSRNKRDLVIGESERTRSCSWGSDRNMSLLDFRSTEDVVNSGFDLSRGQNFWSLEREKNLKHKSESDFRSLGNKASKESRLAGNKSDGKYYVGTARMRRTGEFFEYDNRSGKRSKEINEEIQKTVNRNNMWENRVLSSMGVGDKECCKEVELRRFSREGKENFGGFESQKYHDRRKSLEEFAAFSLDSLEFGNEIPLRIEDRKRVEKRREKKDREERFHEGIKEKEQKEWEREKERRQINRRKSAEEKELRGEEPSRKTAPNDYANFQEIHFKKFDRVVSNQFGRYSEFLTQENTYDLFAQEKKVMENYDKMCQVNRIVKELKGSLSEKYPEVSANVGRINVTDVNNFAEPVEFPEWKNVLLDHSPLTASPRSTSKMGRALVERTKSDPYYFMKNQKRNTLMHQKSIDLTPQPSEEVISDYEDGFKKASRSEHDIPYILHKRHCMNGTAKNSDVIFTKTDLKTSIGFKPMVTSENETKASKTVDMKKLVTEEKKSTFDASPPFKPRPSCAKVAEAKKAGVQIINLDAKNGKTLVNIAESKKVGKSSKPLTAKKPDDLKSNNSKAHPRKEGKRVEQNFGSFSKVKKDAVNTEKSTKIRSETYSKVKENEEPIYAEVCREKIIPEDESLPPLIKIPPQPFKRTSSLPQKPSSDEKIVKLEKILEVGSTQGKSSTSDWGEQSLKISSSQKESSLLEAEGKMKSGWKSAESKTPKESRGAEETSKELVRGKPEVPFSNSVHRRREESLTLFARTRLGLSEGSAFAAIVRQGRVVGSPASQRRAKSLDAPYVSVHSLPPADAFSSKDDTVEGNEGDIVIPVVSRFKDISKGDIKKTWNHKNDDGQLMFDLPGNTESEVDSVFTDDLEVENNFKKAIVNQSKVEMPFPEEKVLDGVRGKRLLSKIESVDFIDSEGDMDSSKQAEPSAIPSDRLVNLPESIRFPSVRQISGQTSEESADGWDQKEVKVKRRTPRRSVGREEQDVHGESVVWDSKDEEPPDDDVWDDKLATAGKYEGVVVNVGLPTEYLKRGSCGQSIDDDNLSTPMKESSPEHWVSVDDLPEALEREEKLLKQQEKILREKILNEKLKRELNLDTIDVDERYCDYKDAARQYKYDEESASLKESFKGYSLDTYELSEKKLKERRGNKNSSSLDEGLLHKKLINALDTKIPTEISHYGKGVDYIQCKVVKDVAEIDQFGDNDEELEEFFVVLDENLGREGRSMIWGDDDTFKRTLSHDESLISVPEEFKDVEKDSEDEKSGGKAVIEGGSAGGVEIRLGGEKLNSAEPLANIENPAEIFAEGGASEDLKPDVGRLSPYGGSRRGSEEARKLSLTEDTGRLSPYDSSSRRSSDEPRRLSASEDAGRLSPFADSRRGSEDPRRLSTSEDSRKCSVSESVSEETRRRLSSTEETRRKRASLTKQCSVGADSLSDEMVSGIQECSSSFENDEKDVFDPEPMNLKRGNEEVLSSALGSLKPREQAAQESEAPRVKYLEINVSEESSNAGEDVNLVKNDGAGKGVHLAPPTSERELSRETEDSVDYGEGDFKEIRETVKEKDISEDLVLDQYSTKPDSQKLASSFEKSESSENDEFRYIDEKRGSTPEIIVGKSKEAVAMSIVVVNEGISVLNKINEKGRKLEESFRLKSLSGIPVTGAAEGGSVEQRHTLPKTITKPKPLTPKPLEYGHRKLTKTVPQIKVKAVSSSENKGSINLLKSSLDSSQESDLDRLSDISLVSHVQNQIARRNLADTGKCLKRDELSIDSGLPKTSSEDEMLTNQEASSEEKEKTDQSDEFVTEEDNKRVKVEKASCLKLGLEKSRTKKEGGCGVGREKRSPDQEKRDSGEDGSSSSSAPLCPKRELSSTWKPFLLESSGSSSLEEGWLPPDENAHLADEEETSSTSNNQQDDSYHDDVDYPTGIGYPVRSVSTAEMMVGGYGSAYALSRTLSRISERSMSEQERSDMEDDITKPSSRSVSVEEESIMSSDHQPSLSSDPPSPKENASAIPDLPVDRPVSQCVEGVVDKSTVCEPFTDVIPPPVPEEDWPSPPSSSSVVDTPMVSHIETFYMEIHPEEACKVVVAESREEGNSSSDENQTLQEESEFLVLSSDNVSASTTTTTQDGTVVIPVRPRSGKRGSLSEDSSMISISDRSVTTSGKLGSNFGEDASERSKSSLLQGGNIECQSEISTWSISSSKYGSEQDSQKSKMSTKITPLKLSSPTGKTFGFFETPVSKVRSPTSQIRFFEAGDRGALTFRSPTSFSETSSPKSCGRFFDSSGSSQVIIKAETSDRRAPKSPTGGKGAQRTACTPYYSNVADSAEKSYFGRYDTGSLERTRIQSSRKCFSYYSVSKTVPNEGDGSNSDGPPAPSPNTIPRASKKTKRRHRVAMDLVVRDGKIVTPPKTNATVVENSDSDRSSPRESRSRETRKKQSAV